MRRSLGLNVLAALLVAGLVVAIAVVASNARSGPDSAQVAARSDDPDDAVGDDVDERDGGGGPPPWAHAGGMRHGDQAWKEAWSALTPEQRHARMAALVKAHEQGMKKWVACVEAAGADRAMRATCERPVPPGLAKKQP